MGDTFEECILLSYMFILIPEWIELRENEEEFWYHCSQEEVHSLVRSIDDMRGGNDRSSPLKIDS